MNDPINEFKRSAQDVRLSWAAFERMRAELVAHMSAHPAAVPSPYARLFALKRPVAALVLIALVGIGGATTYAAHGSLPGDPLYPLKVKVIEPVQGLLAVTPEAKAAFQASIANERLAEAAQLAAKEKLTPEQSASSEQDFNASFRAAQAAVHALAAHDPEAAAHIEDSLTESIKNHQQTLDAAGLSASTTNAKAAHQFSVHVKAEIDSEDEASASTTEQESSEAHGKGKVDVTVPSPAGILHSAPGGEGENEGLFDN